MKYALIIFAVSAVSAAVPGEVHRLCLGQSCQVLAVQDGVVRFIEDRPPAPRNLVLGHYVSADQRLVPRTEAPIRDVRSPRGWRIVVSACFIRGEYPSKLRLRFFDPAGSMWVTHDILMTLEDVEVGRLFGDADEILAITSNEEHVYNAETEIWYLPEHGNPKQVLKILGGLAGC